jgi:signal transduction histidine kinase
VLIVPAVAFLAVASLNMVGQFRSARDFGEGATLAEFGRQVTGLVHDLQAERDITFGFIAEDRPKPVDVSPKAVEAAKTAKQLPPMPNTANALVEQRKNVNASVAEFQAAARSLGGLSSQTEARVTEATNELEALTGVRAAADRRLLTEGAISRRYGDLIARLLAVDGEIGQRSGSRDLTQRVNTLNAMSNLKEQASRERGLLYGIAFASGYDSTQFLELSSAIAEQKAALDRFKTEANDAQRALFAEVVTGQDGLSVRRIEDAVLSSNQLRQLSIDPQQWYAASTTKIQRLRDVENQLVDQVVTQAQNLRSDAQRRAISTGVLIAAILVIAFLTSLLIARSMIRPLRRLRSSALDVAQNRLPAAIERLSTQDGDPGRIAVEPIRVDTRDEIGEVAQTFDALHREAVRLATAQAVLRRQVNDMFVNLSRRSQSLVERQLKLIDELETGEQDPDQLANLFKLDHLATRMRRNSENLLVLAGEDAGRRWGRPIPLVDVLRAATSEVEQYHRVQLTGVPDVEVMGHVVNHLVHLVAELLENATVFSSPESKVLVHSQRLSDGGAMVEIEDRGIGMTGQEIADANERLATPPEFDVSISRMMGLYVVGRLSARHGITVRLRQSEVGGVSAFVRVPSDLLASRFDPREATGGGPGRPGTSPTSIDFNGEFDGGRPAIASLPPGPQPGGQPSLGDLARRALPGPTGPADPAGPDTLPRRTPASTSGLPPAPAGPGGPPGAPPGGFAPIAAGPGGFGSAGPPPPRPPSDVRYPPAHSPSGGEPGPETRNGEFVPGPVRRPEFPPIGGRPLPTPVSPLNGPGGRPGGPGGPGGPGSPGGSGGPGGPGGSGGPGGPGGPGVGAGRPERTPIFEQLQSEWFRRRTPGPRTGPPEPPGDLGDGRPGPSRVPPARPVDRPSGPPGPQPAQPPMRLGAPTGPSRPGARPPVPRPEQGPEGWQSPADEGWRAAERLLSPTTGGTTRAGLPVRVPQAHLVPGGADAPPPPPVAPGPPTYRSPEAVRSRLASYHQGVRRGRHADRRGGNAERDQSDVLVQSQEQS